MNQISNYLRGDNPLGDEYAAAVERLVQAAKSAHETLLAMIEKDIRPMGTASELNAALAAFREGENV